MLNYPQGGGGVSISIADYMRLKPGTYLNDVIIEFYLKYIYFEMNESQRNRSYFFSAYSYFRMSSNDHVETFEIRHGRVARWTKKVNLFEKDFVFVPINFNKHWFLAIICFAGQLKLSNERLKQDKV